LLIKLAKNVGNLVNLASRLRYNMADVWKGGRDDMKKGGKEITPNLILLFQKAKVN